MSDAFYTMLGIVLPILIVQLVQLRQSSIAARKAEDASKAAVADRGEIKSRVASMDTKVTDIHLQTQTIVAHSGLGPITEPGKL